MCALIADELNVKNVQFVTDAPRLYHLSDQAADAHPGAAQYGKLLGKIGQHLAAADGNEVVDELNAGAKLRTLIWKAHDVSLAREDMLIAPMQKPGYVAQNEGEFTVVLDANITPKLLKREGYLREVISKVQTMRKEAGFEVIDRITVYVVRKRAD